MARLSIAQRDALLLARAAIEAGLTARASVLALEGVGRWETYRLEGSRGGVQFRSCDLIPPGWVLYAAAPVWDELLLVHPEAAPFLTRTVGHRKLMARIRLGGPRMFELADALSALLIGALEAPDCPEG